MFAPTYPIVVCLAILIALAPFSVAAGPIDGDAFGNWRVSCEIEAQGGRKGCFIIQNLVLREGGQRVLQFAIGYVTESPDPVALLSLPLGISLPPGAEIQIDDHPPKRVSIERCEPNGCRAGLLLVSEILQMMRTGKQLSIKFYDAKRQPIEVPLSLDGFEAGLAALTPVTS